MGIFLGSVLAGGIAAATCAIIGGDAGDIYLSYLVCMSGMYLSEKIDIVIKKLDKNKS